MLTEREVQRGLRISICEGAFASIHSTLTSGAFLTGFSLMLGVNDFQIALLTSFPLLTQVLQLYSVYVIEQGNPRKWVSGPPSFIGRMLWAFLVLIPFIPGLKAHAIAVFLSVYFLSSSFLSYSTSAWLSWMSDLVPAPIRGRYFGRRNMLLGLVAMLAGIAGGKILDHYQHAHTLAHGFLIIEMTAVVGGLIAFLLLIRQPEPRYLPHADFNFRNLLLQPFQELRFRKYLQFNLFWVFAINISTSFFPVYILKTLNWSFTNIAYLSFGTAALTLLTQPLWGSVIDRFGSKPVMQFCALGIAPIPLLYIFTTPQNFWLIWLDLAFTGIFWSGFNLAILNLLLHCLPTEGRTGFLALQGALTGLVTFGAMTLGGFLAQQLAKVTFNWGGFLMVNYQILFIVTLVLRTLALPLVNRLEEPGAKTMQVLVASMFHFIPRQIRLGYEWLCGAPDSRAPTLLLFNYIKCRWSGRKRR